MVRLTNLALIGCIAATVGGVTASAQEWRPLKVGGGGFVTGIDFSNDGKTMVSRTDTYGGYLWSADSWMQLSTAQRMPASAVNPEYATGTYELVVAPNAPTRLYKIDRSGPQQFGFFFSTDLGKTWTQSATYPAVAFGSSYGPNGTFRTYGKKIAVDPVNPDVVYASGITAVTPPQVSFDGGVTFKPVPGVPPSTGNEGQAISFDRSSGAAGQRTSTVYISSFGKGVFVSKDGGGSFASTTSGGPSNHVHMEVAIDGYLYVTAASPSRVFKYAFNVWTDISPNKADNWQGIATDPFHAERIVVNKSGGFLAVSKDRGTTWQGPMLGSPATWLGACAVGSPAYPNGTASNIRKAIGDVGWLAWTNECYMSTGDIRFDPLVPDKLWLAGGVGVWHATLTYTNSYTSSSQLIFSSQSRGIEQLVANQVVSSAGCGPTVYSLDRAVFNLNSPEAYPSSSAISPTTHSPGQKYPLTNGFAADWARTKPTFLIAIINGGTAGNQSSGYSDNCGKTWTPFGSLPASVAAGKLGGDIAASSTTNFLWSPNDNANPAYTLDGGKTWKDVDLSAFGVPMSGPKTKFETGWGFASVQINRHTVAADRALPGVFYMYNSGMSSIANTSLIWSAGKVTVTTLEHGVASGKTFTVTISGATPSAYNGTFLAQATSSTTFSYALPNNPGSVSAPGKYSNVGMVGIYRTVDGGVTWTKPYSAKLEYSGSNSGVNSLLRAVPMNAGHLFFTAGHQSGGTKGPLFRSTDGGASWTHVANVLEAYSLGFGAPKSGNDYPSVYMVGHVGGVYGVWRSDSSKAQWAANKPAWTNIGTYPLGSYDMVTTITGDMNVWGRVYLGWKGSGYAFSSAIEGAPTYSRTPPPSATR